MERERKTEQGPALWLRSRLGAPCKPDVSLSSKRLRLARFAAQTSSMANWHSDLWQLLQ